MNYFAPSVETLIDEFSKLPGIGRKSAQRLAFHVLSLPEEEALKFAAAIVDAKKNIHCCSICQNLTDQETCTICASPKRDQGTICVVAQPRDVLSFERSREYNGVYHVLHGVLSPMNHIGPDDIRIQELVKRVAAGGITEVIMATNPDTEGEATAMYIARLLKPFDVKITRLAYGIPVGSNLEYADDATLLRALAGQEKLNYLGFSYGTYLGAVYTELFPDNVGRVVLDSAMDPTLSRQGAFEGEKAQFEPGKHALGITYTMGKLLRKTLKLVKVVVNGVAAVGPVINTVTDSTSKAINGQLSSGGALVLGGVNLKIQGDDPSIGVYLTPTTEGAAPMKAPVVIANSPSQVIVQMPTLADGQYTVSLTTQYSGSRNVKEPRTYTFPIILIVGEGGGGDSESPDEI